jgi:flagellar biosynthetic protein FlhB
MAEKEQNPTEQATPFKLSEAKKQGQVAKSLDFNTLVMIVALMASMAIWGRSSWEALCQLCVHLFTNSASLQLDLNSMTAIFSEVLSYTLDLILPFVAVGVVAAILANFFQTGPILSADPIKPKFERLNPVAGFKRVFNKRMLFEAFKSVVKLFFFGSIAYAFFVSAIPGFFALGGMDAESQAHWLADSSVSLLFRLGLGLLIVGIIDIAYVRWSFGKQMMMSRREVKEEVKRREGDPQIRAKIRELQRENLKQAKSMGRLPDADVLITNPTHFAVALRYDRATMNAPVVLAKGCDSWAQEMKSIARQNGVPILERRRLARQLFRHGLLDQPIPADSFVDVARVYAELTDWRLRSNRIEVTQ